LIEKNGGPGRLSPMKADGGAIRVKSRAGRSPPVADSGHELGGGVEVSGELVRLGKRREKWGKGGGCGGDGGHFKPACRGRGRPAGWRHMAGEGRERGRELGVPIDRRTAPGRTGEGEGG
jgi:hypothetical protein